MSNNNEKGRPKYLQSPWLELGIMIIALVLAYLALFIISGSVPSEGMSVLTITALLFAFFIISLLIAFFAVLAGIGGGVIYTPIMLAFTPVNSMIVRATGLIVAMFSGLISMGPFLRTGLGHFRTCLFLNIGQAIGAFLGATGAVYVAEKMGVGGEAMVRLTLGILVLGVGIYFIVRKNLEWPDVKNPDSFTKRVNLASVSYYEESLDRVVEYKQHRVFYGFLCLVLVGAIGGFFGMGGGWAIVPVESLVVGMPLKVAAANSGIILGMGSCVSVWPYFLKGAILPLFVAPWLVGQVVGGLLGSLVLIKVKSNLIRFFLIGVLFFTSFGLVTKGLELFKIIKPVPGQVSIAVFLVILAVVTRMALKSKPQELE